MATITKTYQTTSTHEAQHSGSAIDNLIEKLKFNHFALISMAILVGSCLGGIAAMYVFMNGAPFWQFALGLSVSMANLIACISQASTKWVVRLFGLSLLVNAILVLANLI